MAPDILKLTETLPRNQIRSFISTIRRSEQEKLSYDELNRILQDVLHPPQREHKPKYFTRIIATPNDKVGLGKGATIQTWSYSYVDVSG